MRQGVRLVVAVACLVLVGPTVRAAGTCTVTHAALGSIRLITATCTADAADASFPNTALPVIEGRFISIETNPGATAPTDNYDVTIEDAHGLDVLQGAGANRDTTTTERAAVLFASTSVHPVVDDTDTLTLKIAGNLVNTAQTVVVIAYAPGG